MSLQTQNMNHYLFKSHYANDSTLRESLNELTRSIWGITVLEGQEVDYVPFSMLHEGRVVSNVCVGRFNVVINNQRIPASMIQTVLTDEQHRHNGLIRRLFQHAQRYIEETTQATFFTANSDKKDFYGQFGYQSHELINHYVIRDKFEESLPNETLLKLDWNDHQQRQDFMSKANNRSPVSNQFGFINRNWLLFWFCQHFKQDEIYYAPDLDAYLIYRVEDKVLKLMDIVAETIPTLAQCLLYLDTRQIVRIEIYFTPDLLDVECSPVIDQEDLFFTDSNFPIPDWCVCLPDTQRG